MGNKIPSFSIFQYLIGEDEIASFHLGTLLVTGSRTIMPSRITSFSSTKTYKTALVTSPIHYHHATSAIVPLSSHDSLVGGLSQYELMSAVHSFKPFTAPGPDGLHPFFLKNIGISLVDLFLTFVLRYSIIGKSLRKLMPLIPAWSQNPKRLPP